MSSRLVKQKTEQLRPDSCFHPQVQGQLKVLFYVPMLENLVKITYMGPGLVACAGSSSTWKSGRASVGSQMGYTYLKTLCVSTHTHIHTPVLQPQTKQGASLSQLIPPFG